MTLGGSGPDATGALPPALLASPREADRAVIAMALADGGIPVRTMGDLLEGGAVPAEGGGGGGPPDRAVPLEEAGCVVLTQEALTPAFRDAMARRLEAQPAWAELPVILILEHRRSGIEWRDLLARDWRRANITVLMRPLGSLELQSAVRLAVSVRLRQFSIRDQLSRERELRHELRHRVKNIFATVQAIASMTRRTAGGGDPFEQFGERLAALGRVHGALDRIANESETFESLARTVLQPYLVEGESRIAIAATDAALVGTACNMLGLCLFELATNAAKHGALSVEGGRVSIEFVRARDAARLAWVETGGPSVRPPTRRGYGTRFLTMTLASLFGAPPILDHAPDGFRMTVEGRPRGLFVDAEGPA